MEATAGTPMVLSLVSSFAYLSFIFGKRAQGPKQEESQHKSSDRLIGDDFFAFLVFLVFRFFFGLLACYNGRREE